MKKEKSKGSATVFKLIDSLEIQSGKRIDEAGKGESDKYKIDELLHELQVYQVELEMQNDELRISQEALEKERLRFLNLFNLAPVGYFILNRSLIINECNNAGLDQLGRERSYVINKRFVHFLPPENFQEFYSFINRLINSKKKLSCETQLKSREGKIFHVLLEGSVISNIGTNEPSFYFAIIDITEKKQAEIEQKEMTERLEMALRASSTGTITIHMVTMDVKLDNFALEIMGLDNKFARIKFANFIKIFSLKDRSLLEKTIRKAKEEEFELNLETRINVNSEVRVIEIRGHIKGNDLNRTFAGLITDISNRKKLQEETESLKIAHNKQMLNAVIETQENERRRISSALHDSVGQLLYATSLNLSRSGIEHKAVDNASKLLNEAIRETRNISFELAPSILTDYGLEVALKEMIKRISIPSLKLQLNISGLKEKLNPACELFIFRIVQELLNNIVKHSAATQAQVDVIKKGTTIHITVKDNGIGMKTAKKMTLGTGLLSIRNRVELYEGSFKISSLTMKGTEVNIILQNIK
ncbi:MAG: putative signal transduction histidine kinase [Bacteroidetes bacterium]|nr:putative signal transduction histidine kinase [Bacteroidota bacterium]